MQPATPAVIHILLIEDSLIDAELISRELLRLNSHVEIHRASIKRDYLDLLVQREFDLILSDYILPDLDGLSALSIAQDQQPSVPFIFVSGVLGEERATEALRAGATDYVTKLDLSRIPMVVNRAIQESIERRIGQQAIHALGESEQRFRVMADSAPALIWAIDADGAVIFANTRFQSEFGITADAFAHRGWRSFAHPEDGQIFEELTRLNLQRRSAFNCDIRVVGGNGGLQWIHCELTPRRDGEGRFLGLTGCAVDITQAKEANTALEAEVGRRTEELRLKEEALRQSQKMEAIGQLTGGIAHDFNNMLAGIIGGSELIRQRLRDGRPDECGRYIDAVVQSAHRAANLTQRLLAFSRRQTLDIKGTDINAIILSLEDLLRRTIGETIGLTIDLQPDVWPALTDMNQLESAILNLVINARDAMPDGGEIIIKSCNLAAAKAASKKDYVIVEVSDNGSGMTEEVKTKAFDPFFTTKPIGQGTGLGLSMIYGFIAQSGGLVQVSSEPGQGTTISLHLPRSAFAPELRDGVDRSHYLVSGRGTVLVVEDEAILRMLVNERLREAGYTVVEAKNATEALHALQGNMGIDLLLTDVGLPGMSGAELALHARKLRPTLRIIFVSGYSGGAHAKTDFVGEQMDFLHKPFDFAELVHKVSELLIAPDKS